MSAIMTSTPTLEKQAESLDILSHFLSINKESVIAAAEESRRQMQLTEEERKKIEEAKAYISKHALLSATMDKREADLAAAKDKHEKAVKDHAAHVLAENTRLENFAAKNAAQAVANEQARLLNEKESKRLAELAVAYDKQNREAIAANNATAAKNKIDCETNERARAANEKEAARLAAEKDAQRAAAKRLQELAANL
jgi:hypothetical protein